MAGGRQLNTTEWQISTDEGRGSASASPSFWNPGLSGGLVVGMQNCSCRGIEVEGRRQAPATEVEHRHQIAGPGIEGEIADPPRPPIVFDEVNDGGLVGNS